jgi:hypothetical protein
MREALYGLNSFDHRLNQFSKLGNHIRVISQFADPSHDRAAHHNRVSQ